MNRPRMRWGLLFVASVLLLAGCQNQPDTRIRPQNLLDDPEQHIGKTVVVSGEVNQIYTPRSFTIGGPDFGQNLLIVSSDSLAPVGGRTEEVPTAKGDIVQVTGVVKRFDADTFEQQYDVTLPPDAASKFEGQPAIVARQAAQSTHGILVSPRVPAGARGPVSNLAMATDPSKQPALQGRVGTFPSAQILRVIQPRLFWVGSNEDRRLLVVVNPASTPNREGENAQTPEPGEEWRLHGVFRRLPGPGILRADWDLSPNLIEELKNQEVYLNAVTARPVEGQGS